MYSRQSRHLTSYLRLWYDLFNPDKGDKMSSVQLFKNIPNDKLPSPFCRYDVEQIYACNERAAQRLIHEWLAKKNIQFSHKLNRKIYYLKHQSEFSTYQKSFIDNYLPNKSFFLTKSERASLHKMALINPHIDFETYSVRLFERMLVDLSWASSHLEGNTFSLLETEQLLLKNEAVIGKTALETQMILNHKEAIKFIILNRANLHIESYTFKSIHALLAENLLSNLNAVGALRKIPVGITGTIYTPISIPQTLEDEFDIFLKKASEIKDAFEQSLFILIFLPYLQPFEDINKRTSRISCNIPLIKNNFIPISFKNINQSEYALALKDVYEKNNADKMKNIFMSALQFSIAEYSHIVSVMITPKDIFIKYRLQIKQTIYNCVVKNKKPTSELIKEINPNDRAEILAHIKNELAHLHEGQLVRFGLKNSEFKKWKKK